MFQDAMHRQVALLAAAQALLQTASVMVMAIGGLAGAAIAANPQLATLPIATLFLGTAITIIPASGWMARVGRRTGFVAGAALGVLGGLLALAGAATRSLGLLAAGTLCIGMYQGFGQFYRFAASEVSTEAFRPRAISLVVAGGVVAAIAGPWLGRVGGPMLGGAYAGSFLFAAIAAALAVGVAACLRVPMPPAGGRGGRALRDIVRQPAYLVALFGAASAYGMMILAMTATPLAMVQHAHHVADTTSVLQLHVLGMFVPSFFTGSLVARFGVLRIMMAGVALIAAHVLVSLTGTAWHSFAGSLLLLGVGWNFLFVGGTALLTTTYTPEERSRAQATNDMVLFAMALLGSLAAAPVLQAIGWQALNMALLPWLAAVALAIGALGWVRPAAASGAR